MRLWHELLIPKLPRQQLLGQHRECCALRGKGWGKPHSTVNYVFDHPYEWLVAYHYGIMCEMLNRGYQVDKDWFKVNYRGKKLGFEQHGVVDAHKVTMKLVSPRYNKKPIYPEHNAEYLQECLENIKAKGVNIEV